MDRGSVYRRSVEGKRLKMNAEDERDEGGKRRPDGEHFSGTRGSVSLPDHSQGGLFCPGEVRVEGTRGAFARGRVLEGAGSPAAASTPLFVCENETAAAAEVYVALCYHPVRVVTAHGLFKE